MDIIAILCEEFGVRDAIAKRVVELLEGRTASADSAISPEYITGDTFPVKKEKR